MLKQILRFLADWDMNGNPDTMNNMLSGQVTISCDIKP